MKRPIPLVDIILVLVVFGALFALVVSCAPLPSHEASYGRSVADECRTREANAGRSSNEADRRALMEGARACWNHLADASSRAAALARMPVAIQMPHEAPDWQPSTPTFRTPDAPEPLPIPGIGAQTPQRGPVTWGETPFDVPPIMRDVPVEQFPWLAH